MADQTKVLVPKEVAKELRELGNSHKHPFYALSLIFTGGGEAHKKDLGVKKYPNTFDWAHSNYNGGKKERLAMLANALSFGYEAEKTSEEKAAEVYSGLSSYDRMNVRRVLEAADVKIAGITEGIS